MKPGQQNTQLEVMITKTIPSSTHESASTACQGRCMEEALWFACPLPVPVPLAYSLTTSVNSQHGEKPVGGSPAVWAPSAGDSLWILGLGSRKEQKGLKVVSRFHKWHSGDCRVSFIMTAGI